MVAEGERLEVEGLVLRGRWFQWYLNDQPIPGALAPRVVTDSTPASWDGQQLHLEAWNDQVRRAGPQVRVRLQVDVPSLHIRFNGGLVEVSWEADASWILEQAMHADGPWSDAPASNSPYVLSPQEPRFFRLHRP